MNNRDLARAIRQASDTVRQAYPDHQHMIITRDNEDGTAQARLNYWAEDVTIKVKVPRGLKIQAGSSHIIGYEEGNRQLPFVVGRGNSGAAAPLNRPYFRGLWDQGQGWPSLTSTGESRMVLLTMTSQPSLNWPTTHPIVTDANNGILGVVVFQNGATPKVAFLYQEILSVTARLRLACWAMAWGANSSSRLWDIPLPNSDYPILDEFSEEGYIGNRWDFLFHDEGGGTFNVVGHGSSTRRKQLWTISEAGVVLAEFTAPFSMLQSTYYSDRWVKGWARYGSENAYDQVDHLIRCFQRKAAVVSQIWAVDPVALLVGNQLASHSNSGLLIEELAQNIANQTTGRIPVNPSALSGAGKICLWVSGIVAGLTTATTPLDPYAAVMLAGGGGEVVDGGGTHHPAPPCLRTSLPAFAAHKAQNAALIHLRGDTGAEVNRHEINFSVSAAVYETASIASWSAYHATNVANPTVDGVATLQEAALQGFSGTIDKDYTYGGLAGDLALSLASPGSIDFEGDIGDLEPFSATWRFEGGYGFKAPFDGTIIDCSHCPTPPYVYLVDSHIRLQPLPRTTAPDGELGDDGLAPHDLALTSLSAIPADEMRRLDPLGGVTVEDIEGVCWSAYTRTTAPIVYGSKRLLAQITSSGYTYDPDTTAITVETDQTTYQLGDVGWGVTTKLVSILPDGTATEYDIGYKFTSCVVPGAPGDTITSTREREYAGKIYEIKPCPLAGTIVLIRDRIDALSDGGHMENVPFLVAEVRLYSDPSIVVGTYELSDNTLETPTDPDTGDPLPQRRQYQQYDLNNGRLTGNCRGCVDITSGREQLVQVLSVVQQSDSAVYYRAVRIYWPFGGNDTPPQVDLICHDSAPPEFSNPLLWASWAAAIFTGGKVIFPGATRKTTDGYSGWCVVVRDA